MNLIFNNRNFRVYFKHVEQAGWESHRRDTREQIPARNTLCAIFEYPNGFQDKYYHEVSNGRTNIHYKDRFKFNKSVGRKLALQKALNSSNLNKMERTVIWNAYHKMMHNEHYINQG